MDTAQKHQLLFTQLVVMFHAATMQQLGKVKHPVTDKIEKDLEAAENTIDILDMLQAKTQGNLAPDEEALLKQIVQELKLAFVQEKQS
jgi:tellurite resistance protein